MVGAEAPFRQLVGETRRAVGIVEVVVIGPDLVDQVGINGVPGTRSPLAVVSPIVVGRGRDAKGPTGETHVMAFGLSGGYPPVATHRVDSSPKDRGFF